jgi:adenine phosphoribosyltransferase
MILEPKQQEYYQIDIAGRQESLPILPLPNGKKIAFFNLHGNVDLTEHCAKSMIDIVKHADILMTVESKGLQLTHCLARNLGHSKYAVARKSHKLYMQDGLSLEYKSITTKSLQRLYLSSFDAKLIEGKSIAMVDDVISTGGSMQALCQLAKNAGASIQVVCCVLAEGDAAQRRDINYLGAIPLL